MINFGGTTLVFLLLISERPARKQWPQFQNGDYISLMVMQIMISKT